MKTNILIQNTESVINFILNLKQCNISRKNVLADGLL